MSKKIQFYIKLQVLSGMANPSPPVGPILGQKGVNIISFCKLFNERTNTLDKGIPIPVIITVYSDRSFSFITKTPPVSYLIKKEVSLKSGSTKPGHDIIGYISKQSVLNIAKIKSSDVLNSSLESISNSIIGTARSMGILIKN